MPLREAPELMGLKRKTMTGSKQPKGTFEQWEFHGCFEIIGCAALKIVEVIRPWYVSYHYFAYRFESSFGTNDNVLTIRGSDTLLEAPTLIHIQWERVWNTQEVMDACPFNTASHFLGWSGAPNWIFCLPIWEWFWEKRRHCIDHKGGQIFCLWHFQSFLYNQRG